MGVCFGKSPRRHNESQMSSPSFEIPDSAVIPDFWRSDYPQYYIDEQYTSTKDQYFELSDSASLTKAVTALLTLGENEAKNDYGSSRGTSPRRHNESKMSSPSFEIRDLKTVNGRSPSPDSSPYSTSTSNFAPSDYASKAKTVTALPSLRRNETRHVHRRSRASERVNINKGKHKRQHNESSPSSEKRNFAIVNGRSPSPDSLRQSSPMSQSGPSTPTVISEPFTSINDRYLALMDDGSKIKTETAPSSQRKSEIFDGYGSSRGKPPRRHEESTKSSPSFEIRNFTTVGEDSLRQNTSTSNSLTSTPTANSELSTSTIDLYLAQMDNASRTKTATAPTTQRKSDIEHVYGSSRGKPPGRNYESKMSSPSFEIHDFVTVNGRSPSPDSSMQIVSTSNSRASTPTRISEPYTSIKDRYFEPSEYASKTKTVTALSTLGRNEAKHDYRRSRDKPRPQHDESTMSSPSFNIHNVRDSLTLPTTLSLLQRNEANHVYGSSRDTQPRRHDGSTMSSPMFEIRDFMTLDEQSPSSDTSRQSTPMSHSGASTPIGIYEPRTSILDQYFASSDYASGTKTANALSILQRDDTSSVYGSSRGQPPRGSEESTMSSLLFTMHDYMTTDGRSQSPDSLRQSISSSISLASSPTAFFEPSASIKDKHLVGPEMDYGSRIKTSTAPTTKRTSEINHVYGSFRGQPPRGPDESTMSSPLFTMHDYMTTDGRSQSPDSSRQSISSSISLASSPTAFFEPSASIKDGHLVGPEMDYGSRIKTSTPPTTKRTSEINHVYGSFRDTSPRRHDGSKMSSPLFAQMSGRSPSPYSSQSRMLTPNARAKTSDSFSKTHTPIRDGYQQASTTTSRTTQHKNEVKHIYGPTRGITVQIVMGSITLERTDCIVHATNEQIDFKGQIGRALLKEGGPTIRVGGIIVKNCRVGPPGKLPCKKIIHVNIHKHKALGWTKLILACLEYADHLNFTSISLPLLGTGLFKQPATKVAQYCRHAITDYISKGGCLQMITVITPVANTVPILHQELKYVTSIAQKRCQHMGAISRNQVQFSWKLKGIKVEVVFGCITKENTDCIVHPTNKYLNFKGDIGAAILKAAGSLVKPHMVRIPNVCTATASGRLPCNKLLHLNIHKISDFSWDELILKCLAKADELGMTSISLPIIGTGKFQRNVIEVAGFFRLALEEYLCYKDSSLRTIRFISIDESALIILQREIDNVSTTKPHGTAADDQSTNSGIYVQTLPGNTGRTKYGIHWTAMRIHDVPRKEPLATTSLEYQSVSHKLVLQVKGAHIIQIERIQTPTLYKSYQLQKRMLLHCFKNVADSGTSISQRLWHGCSKDVTDNIRQTGFNRSFCGQNGTLFGQGVYFAKDASLSARNTYAKPDKNGYKYIFLCDVITGAYTKGTSSMKEPPRLDQRDPNAGYHSVVDNVANPGIFVVFRDDRAYPEYLITFTK